MPNTRKTSDLLHALQEDRAECAPIEESEDSIPLSIVDVGPPPPSFVVYPARTATKLTGSLRIEYRALVGAKLPLKVTKDLAAVRAALLSEFPHAASAVELVLRDLREGEPVRIRPVLLVGPPGSGKSRLARRLFELLAISVYRYDGSGATDGQFAGSPKAWSNSIPSAPMRAVSACLTANPAVVIEEIEKAGSSPHMSRLWDAVLVFLDRETAARHRDVGLDAPVDLSWISYTATANSVDNLPAPLKDRFRIVRVPEATLAHLPALASNVARELACESGEAGFVAGFAPDELAAMGGAWQRQRFSIRALQKIVVATIETREVTATRH
ncbi:AAA family ATPase [Bradyrhizobium sp. 2TAF36]|jgi:ATP-dependent Lon protease|uniref:AAA family ATPase n=1 Tax=unclassified Bradyrhizobium TaxID=2631580 RepID=UPI0014304620|nr:AAA family ATPase [Bradyrhizobium sp. MOS001]